MGCRLGESMKTAILIVLIILSGFELWRLHMAGEAAAYRQGVRDGFNLLHWQDNKEDGR